MPYAPTSREQTAALRAAMAPAADTALTNLFRAASDRPDIRAAMAWLEGDGLLCVTTRAAAALNSGRRDVACDTDMVVALAMLADEALKARARAANEAAEAEAIRHVAAANSRFHHALACHDDVTGEVAAAIRQPGEV